MGSHVRDCRAHAIGFRRHSKSSFGGAAETQARHPCNILGVGSGQRETSWQPVHRKPALLASSFRRKKPTRCTFVPRASLAAKCTCAPPSQPRRCWVKRWWSAMRTHTALYDVWVQAQDRALAAQRELCRRSSEPGPLVPEEVSRVTSLWADASELLGRLVRENSVPERGHGPDVPRA